MPKTKYILQQSSDDKQFVLTRRDRKTISTKDAVVLRAAGWIFANHYQEAFLKAENRNLDGVFNVLTDVLKLDVSIMKYAKLLKWTPEMEAVRSDIIYNKKNIETWPLEVFKVRETSAHTFFLFVPPDPVHASGDACDAIHNGDEVIQVRLPIGYKLVAWYGWGRVGWLAQTVRISESV